MSPSNNLEKPVQDWTLRYKIYEKDKKLEMKVMMKIFVNLNKPVVNDTV